MQKTKAKLPSLRKLSRHQMLVCAAVLLLVVIILISCISINMRSHMQREYATVRNKLGDALYSNLYMLIQTFDMAAVPNADIQNAILPQMREYYIASTTLNDAIVQSYGEKYRVLTLEAIATLDDAFDAYDSAFYNGAATDLAKADMQTCMENIRTVLSTRFGEGILKPTR